MYVSVAPGSCSQHRELLKAKAQPKEWISGQDGDRDGLGPSTA